MISLLYLVSLGWSRTWFCRGLKTLWGYLVLSSYCIVLKSVEQTGQKPHGISFLAIFAVSRDPNPWLCQLGASWVLESDRSSIRGTLSLSLSLSIAISESLASTIVAFGCYPSVGLDVTHQHAIFQGKLQYRTGMLLKSWSCIIAHHVVVAKIRLICATSTSN